ncbi:MAG TPA: GPW/gp25 family protein [Pseudomonadota bacterium]|nr:GPW/gp25 family protein [Pseudomonadota bacterium]HNF97223.1 GPW/gp25 family protein [Pseudomonadota bacterium]HNN51222.1 GPW/gp25 family protein [Pseudomonadota bacterium]
MGFFNRFRELPKGDSVLDSVQENLHHVLNAKEGYSSVIRDYGLGQYYAQPDTIHAMRTLLREMMDDINRYEPRLKVTSLMTKGRDSSMALHLDLIGIVGGVTYLFKLRFDQIYNHFLVDSAHDLKALE